MMCKNMKGGMRPITISAQKKKKKDLKVRPIGRFLVFLLVSVQDIQMRKKAVSIL